MGIPLADDSRVNVCNRPLLTFPEFHSVNHHRDPMRDLLIKAVECFLPDQLRDDLTFRLVRHRVLVVKPRTVREVL